MEYNNSVKSETNPLVSVIIPTRNRLIFLKKALQSVYEQTYKNKELIVIDDQSNDGTSDYLKEELKRTGIKYIRNEDPQGASKARNLGIQNANGEIISFLDDDDEWYPEKLEIQIPSFADPDVGMVYTGAEIVKVDYNLSYYSTPSLNGHIFDELLIENRIGTTNTVAMRSAIAKELLFDESFPAREEYDLWLRAAKKYKILGINEPLVRVYGRNTLNRITSDINNYIVAVEMLNKKYEKEIRALPKSKQRERVAAQSFFLGSQALMANELSLCRKYFFKSYIQHPRLKYIGGLTASFFGPEMLFRLRKLKKIT